MKALIEHRRWEWKPTMVVMSEERHCLYVLDSGLKTEIGEHIDHLIVSEGIIFPTDHQSNLGHLIEMIDEFNPLISVLSDSRFNNPRYTVWCRPTHRHNATVGMFSDNILGMALSKSLVEAWNDYSKFIHEVENVRERGHK